MLGGFVRFELSAGSIRPTVEVIEGEGVGRGVEPPRMCGEGDPPSYFVKVYVF